MMIETEQERQSEKTGGIKERKKQKNDIQDGQRRTR